MRGQLFLAASLWASDALALTLQPRQTLANSSLNIGPYESSPPFYPSPWADGSGGWADAYARAQDFVRQMTLLEKVNLTTGTGWQSEACVGSTGAIPRLGFPSLCLQDAPLGVRFADYVSAFPAGGTVAASWDRRTWYQRGVDMGEEHRDKGVDIQLGPVVGPLGRAPAGGRNWEGFSPDPVLSGIAVAESVRGIQDAGVIACTKHYILNEQEHFRQVPEAAGYGFNISETLSSNLDDITMHELYLWPFADAVRAGTGAIMCSYQQINNSYGCQNSYTMNYLLKGELGFQGFVLSDWAAQHAGVSTALAGMDMAMPGDVTFVSGTAYWGANMTASVLNGTLPEWRLDDMATRIIAAYYLVGRDKNAVPVNFNSWNKDTFGYRHYVAEEGYGLINQHVDVRAEHRNNIRESAAKSTILLKNEGVLPLNGREKFTGVFGEDADNNAWGPNGCPDRGCDNGTLAMGWGSGTADFPYLVTPLTAIQNEVLTTSGNVVQGVTDNWAYTQINAVAKQASVAIVFINADSGEGYISVDGNEGDRNNLTAWRNGDVLVQNVTAACNNTIVVVHSVGPILVAPWYDNPNVTAIVWASLPGEQSGNSLTDVLYGRVNPGGKLPFTLARNREDYGTDVLYEPNNGEGPPQDEFVEGVFIDYRYLDKNNIEPIYEFGYGMSYTTFEYSNVQVQAHEASPYQPNTGTTQPAPTLGSFENDTSSYQFPPGFDPVDLYIYPYLNGTDYATALNSSDYGLPSSEWLPPNSQDGSAQPRIAAGGAPGGNPQLYDILFTVTATITNTGSVAGDEVVQLYLSRGGPNDPVRELRGFDRLTIATGASATFSADLTRRDVSNWDPVSQDWVITQYPKNIFVGASSRNLPLTAALDMSGVGGMGGGAQQPPAQSGYSAQPPSQSGSPVQQIPDGQVQGGQTGSPVQQIPDGQVQQGGQTGSPVHDGQVQCTPGSGYGC